MMLAATLGTGTYSPTQAARLAGLTPSRVRRWVKGYDFKAPDGEVRSSPPLVGPEPAAELDFAALVEVLFVHAFLKQGVPMYWIRRAADVARELYQTPHPFSLKQLKTDGHRIFAVLSKETAEEVIMELASGQHLFAEVIRPYLKQLEYEDDIVARWWPLGRADHVVIDPHRSFGQPIVAGRGVPTAVLYAAHVGGQSHAEIASWYRVPLEEVQSALRFEEQIRQQRKAA